LSSGILAGLYPAFFITRFQPALTLKGKSGEAGSRHSLRKILMVAQFTISMTLIVGAFIIYRQLQFIRSKPLGFQKDQVVVLPIFGSGASSIDFNVDASIRQRMNTFADELRKNSRIK